MAPLENADHTREVLRPVLRRRWWLVLAIGLIVGALCYVYFDRQPSSYTAGTALFFETSSARNELGEQVQLTDPERAARNEAILLRSRKVAAEAARQIGFKGDPSALLGAISVSPATDTRLPPDRRNRRRRRRRPPTSPTRSPAPTAGCATPTEPLRSTRHRSAAPTGSRGRRPRSQPQHTSRAGPADPTPRADQTAPADRYSSVRGRPAARRRERLRRAPEDGVRLRAWTALRRRGRVRAQRPGAADSLVG